VRQIARKENFIVEMGADLAAAAQTAIAETLVDRVQQAMKISKAKCTALVVAGGVAANKTIRAKLQIIAAQQNMDFIAPPVALCTDNAAMIAWAAIERQRTGMAYPADEKPRPRWPLS
jgi:N6-L-threonylcarbamoyladenine synthase